VAAAKLVLSQSTRFEFKHEPLGLCHGFAAFAQVLLGLQSSQQSGKKAAQRLGVDGVTLAMERNRSNANIFSKAETEIVLGRALLRDALKAAANRALGADAMLAPASR